MPSLFPDSLLVTGSVTGSGNVVLYTQLTGTHEEVTISLACKGAATLYEEITHDGGTTWTKTKGTATSSALSGGTTDYDRVINYTVQSHPNWRLNLVDTSTATNPYRGMLTFIEKEVAPSR